MFATSSLSCKHFFITSFDLIFNKKSNTTVFLFWNILVLSFSTKATFGITCNVIK